MEFLLPVVILSVVMWTVVGVRGEIRCYCNDASCISTGYMCKSALGKCYSMTYEPDQGSNSAREHSANHAKSVHGCVEFLPERDICSGHGDIYTQARPQQWPAVMCCTDDMCNYMASMDINIYINTQSNTSQGGRGKSYSRDGASHHMDNNYHQRELWFKAAVIAVPIAGGFILILLVFLAVRMLRQDNRRHRQLLQIRQNRSLNKAQLYVTNHFCDKHQHHQHFSEPGCKAVPPHHLYKDVNIKVDRGGHGYEKISSSDTSNQSDSCSSVVVWGRKEPDKSDPATVV